MSAGVQVVEIGGKPLSPCESLPRVPSAVDAVVAAVAEDAGGATVLTSDPRDLRALARHTSNTVRIGTD